MVATAQTGGHRGGDQQEEEHMVEGDEERLAAGGSADAAAGGPVDKATADGKPEGKRLGSKSRKYQRLVEDGLEDELEMVKVEVEDEQVRPEQLADPSQGEEEGGSALEEEEDSPAAGHEGAAGAALAPMQIGKPTQATAEDAAKWSDEPAVGDEDMREIKVKVAENRSKSSSRRTFINAIICFVGTGMYGLPIAFLRVGIIGGLIGMAFVTVITLHCMFLVVDCRCYLESECSKQIRTYGDIGYYAFGILGARMVDSFVMLSQIGFCIAYLIIIAQSMHEVFGSLPKKYWILFCMPVLVRTSWLRSLKSLAPLSLLAELASLLAAVIVLFFDVREIITFHNEGHKYSEAATILHAKNNRTVDVFGSESQVVETDPLTVVDWTGVPYFFGVSIYTFEGIGMVIPVLNSMQEPADFKTVWAMALGFVALLNTAFGFLGYYAFRSGVADIVISNLPHFKVTIFMKISLCIGLYFTYPIMLFPVIEMIEESFGRAANSSWLSAAKWNLGRSALVIGTGLVAICVPKFSIFIGLVGASAGAALAFVLPSAFHLKLRFQALSKLHCCREGFCIAIGTLGGIVGTMSAIRDLRDALSAG